MEKIDLPIGKKVKGYGLRNEYGEFQFIPAQIGTRTDGMRLVTENEAFQIFECKKKIKVVMNFKKCGKGIDNVINFSRVASNLMLELKKYDI